MSNDLSFAIGDKVVYPSHGVGEIIDIETQTIAGTKLEVYVVNFTHEKMTLKVPTSRAKNAGLRHIVGQEKVDKVFKVLNDKPKRGNKMWSRRAQEYESKINSGNIELVAEVVRDLYKNIDNDRSYSERMIYEAALNRLASEIAVFEGVSTQEYIDKLVELLKEKLEAA